MYGYESWTTKRAESRKTDAFELWCWRRLLRVPWTAKRSNQSILNEISPEYSLEGLMLKLKRQFFGHLMRRADSFEIRSWCWERLKAGGEGDERGWWLDGWMASLTQWTWVCISSRSWWWTGRPGLLQSMGSQMVGHDWATELNWLGGNGCTEQDTFHLSPIAGRNVPDLQVYQKCPSIHLTRRPSMWRVFLDVYLAAFMW